MRAGTDRSGRTAPDGTVHLDRSGGPPPIEPAERGHSGHTAPDPTARTLGVIGTLVWDRFVRPADGGHGPVDRHADTAGPLEGWGGIAYALSALSASLPGGWTALPVVKVGIDLADDGVRFLESIPRVDTSAVSVVEEPNNRVELRYESASERRERLVGGVPPWTAEELAEIVRRCDALYVNFVSGMEMDLDAVRALADCFGGPRYGDLHSLFLGVGPEGRRIPRRLDDAWSWARCFHVVQMNEEELRLAAGGENPWERAAREVAGGGPRLVAVTRGARGSACVTAAGVDDDPWRWGGAGSAAAPRRRPDRDVRSSAPSPSGDERPTGTMTVPTRARWGDPTGCGDVWGAAFFARLLAGDSLAGALEEANRLAGINVEHRSAEGLAERLRTPSVTAEEAETTVDQPERADPTEADRRATGPPERADVDHPPRAADADQPPRTADAE